MDTTWEKKKRQITEHLEKDCGRRYEDGWVDLDQTWLVWPSVCWRRFVGALCPSGSKEMKIVEEEMKMAGKTWIKLGSNISIWLQED